MNAMGWLKMEGRILLAYALIAGLVAIGIWLTVGIIAKRRAYKLRARGSRTLKRDA